MSNLTVQKIKEWLELRNFNLERFVQAYNIPDNTIYQGEEIYKLKKLILVDKPDILPAHFYFYPSGDIALIHIYQEILNQLSETDITAFYGKAESIETSRAGKTAHYNVYAKQGFAFSSLGKEIHFLDIFPATTTKEYTENIYQRPGPFIR